MCIKLFPENLNLDPYPHPPQAEWSQYQECAVVKTNFRWEVIPGFNLNFITEIIFLSTKKQQIIVCYLWFCCKSIVKEIVYIAFLYNLKGWQLAKINNKIN